MKRQKLSTRIFQFTLIVFVAGLTLYGTKAFYDTIHVITFLSGDTSPGTIAGDTGGGWLIHTNSGGKGIQVRGSDGTVLLDKLGGALEFLGSASGTMTLGADSTAANMDFITTAGTVIFPGAADTAVYQARSATLTNKTLTSPVINGTPTGTGIPTITLKKGSGAGNYSTASTTYAVVDSTNLCYTVTIPTGWKLAIAASGLGLTSTAVVQVTVALTDNAACSTANAGILVEQPLLAPSTGNGTTFSINYVVNGDGAAHNIALQFKTANGADSALVVNNSSTILPTMFFNLTPSN